MGGYLRQPAQQPAASHPLDLAPSGWVGGWRQAGCHKHPPQPEPGWLAAAMPATRNSTPVTRNTMPATTKFHACLTEYHACHTEYHACHLQSTSVNISQHTVNIQSTYREFATVLRKTGIVGQLTNINYNQQFWDACSQCVLFLKLLAKSRLVDCMLTVC